MLELYIVLLTQTQTSSGFLKDGIKGKPVQNHSTTETHAENFRLYLNFIKESLCKFLLNKELNVWCKLMLQFFFRGECGLREYSEVKTVTIKIPQKNS